MHPEYFRGDPLLADDLDGRNWRRVWLFHNRLHVLLYGALNCLLSPQKADIYLK